MNLLRRLRDRMVDRFAPAHDPLHVTHAQALRWFTRRRAEYDRLVAAVAPFVRPDSTVFDVGANIGYFSLLLARATALRGRLELFEPLPHLANLCHETFRSEPGVMPAIRNFGLSDVDGEARFLVAGNGNIGWNTLIAAGGSPDMHEVNVAVRRFDATGITAVPDLIKIDVEGAEYKVLRGMANSLRAWQPRPVILCEVAWGRVHPDWEAEVAAFAELAALGYRFVDLDGSPVQIATLTATCDILCLPSHLKASSPVPGN
ncbi:MAG: FkbM family methyltransferase [Acidobacteriota bacterium]